MQIALKRRSREATPEKKKDLGKNRANELDGKRWIQNSVSIWSDLSKSSEERSLGHPAMFPQALAERIIDTFSPGKGSLIVDPFLGTGSTILGAFAKERNAVGLDISSEYVKLAKQRVSEAPSLLVKRRPKIEIYNDGAENLLRYVKPGSVDLCFTSPPYWDILEQRRTADGKEQRDYQTKKIISAQLLPTTNLLKVCKVYLLRYTSQCESMRIAWLMLWT